ncbi:hypothetical protein DQ384_38945 [Sphaerisporangium album]|uniref:DivIVA domain-containing protein n=1 Tax=Sphaerisporangium album TaxID=509200 RepID=A0A367EKP8_9ACTN|nr:hypothetical protein [Sphaerisporangium album]RCG18678.1 hypothetical protein DQ384_38945 [Sphaerisporangium album]
MRSLVHGNEARRSGSMWHDSYVLVLLAVAALAVLSCVVVVSQGRGGELVEFAPDVPPLELPAPGQLTAADFMDLHLPVSLVGYHTQTVDETLQRAATAIGQRDTHIAVLEQRLEELLAGRIAARQESYARPSWAPIATPEPGPPIAEHESAEALFGVIGQVTPVQGVSATPPSESGTGRRGLSAEPSAEERGPFEAATEPPPKRALSAAPVGDRDALDPKERGPFDTSAFDAQNVDGSGKERGAFETPGGSSGKHAASNGGAAGERPGPEDA